MNLIELAHGAASSNPRGSSDTNEKLQTCSERQERPFGVAMDFINHPHLQTTLHEVPHDSSKDERVQVSRTPYRYTFQVHSGDPISG